MTTRVGINGFGRMGKLCLRAGWGRRSPRHACRSNAVVAAGLEGLLGDEVT